MEYVVLGIAFIVILGLIIFLVNKLTPNNWDSLRGGLGDTFKAVFTIAVVVVIFVFLGLFLFQLLS